MYNRYVPQPDGSFARNRMQDRPQTNKPPAPTPPAPEPDCNHPPKPPVSHCPPEPTPGSFLRRLIPGDFDTGDLIVILLLLLMAGDSEEGRNNAILTIALYFLM